MTHDLDSVIDDVLDQVADPAERAWLDQRMTIDSGTRERFADRKTLFGVLDTAMLQDPPPDLLPGVLRQIAGVRRQPAPAGGWLDRLAMSFRRHPVLALGYGAALAAGLAVLTLSVIRSPLPHGRGTQPATGTMAPLTSAPVSRVIAGDAQVDISIARDGAALVVEFATRTSGPAELTLSCGAGVSAAEALWVRGGGAPPEVAPDRVHVDFSAPGALRVRFETLGPRGPLATATLRRGGEVSTTHIHVPPAVSAGGL
ncbi:MAG: hypothetical protein ACHQ52_08065 [Candidatus Eisenbacteria bacterium]